MKVKNEYIEVIDIMRLAAALLVTVYHSGIIGDHGFFGVDIMFVISGYLMMKRTVRDRNPAGIFLHKARRIVPVYWLATIVMYLIIRFAPQLSVMSEAKPEYLIKSLLFIPYTNSLGYSAPILGMGWMLNYEMFFALIFSVAYAINKEQRGVIATGIIVVLIVLSGLISFPSELAWYADTIMLEFVLGIAAYYLLAMLPDKEKEYYPGAMEKRSNSRMLIIPLCAAVCFACESMTGTIPRWIVLGIPMAVCFTVVMYEFADRNFNPKLISVGKCAYEMHIVGYFASAAYKALTANAGMAVRIIGVIVMLAVTVIVSYYVHVLLQKIKLVK